MARLSVLVTGGAGYIGRWLARELLRQEIEMVALDRQPVEPGAKLSLPAEVPFVEGDVTDREAVLRASRLRPFGTLIHLAGIVTMGCERDPELGMRVNVYGMHNVLEVARQAGIPRLVFASTISVYKPDAPQPMDESTPAEPLGWYGQSKVLAEQLGLFYARRYGLDFRAARLAAIVGPFRFAASGSATMYTSHILEKAALGEPYYLDVDERAATPICYVKDCARALAALATVPQAPGRIYNIGTGRASALGLIEIARSRCPGARLEFRPEPNLAAVARLSEKWELSIERAAEDLGWRPAYTLETMADDLMVTVRGEIAV